MNAQEAEVAFLGGVVGAVVIFLGWAAIISRQLKRAEASINNRGFGE